MCAAGLIHGSGYLYARISKTCFNFKNDAIQIKTVILKVYAIITRRAIQQFRQ